MNFPLWLRLAGRLLRSPDRRRAAWLVVGLDALVVAVYVLASATALSPGQIASRDLGRFDALVDLSGAATVTSEAARVAEALDANGAAAEATEAALVLQGGNDFSPVGHLGPKVSLMEAPWEGLPFPDRFELVNGRWPTEPGEAAVTVELRRWVDTSSVEVLSGAGRLTIVGTVRDRYAQDSLQFLAAPGTWAALPWDVLPGRYPLLGATPQILVNGLASDAAGELAVTSLAPSDASAVLVRMRDDILGRDASGIVNSQPFIYTIPSFLLPAVAILAMVGIMLPWIMVTYLRLLDVGVARLTIITCFSTVVIALTAAAATLALVVGGAVGVGARPLLDLVHPRPLSAAPWPASPAFRLLLVSLVTCLILAVIFAIATLSRVERGAQQTSTERQGRQAHRLLRISSITDYGSVLVLALFLGALLNVREEFDAFWVVLLGTLALIIAAPRIVRSVVGRLPRHDAGARLAARRLDSRLAGSVTALALTAVLAGPFITIGLLVNSASSERAAAPRSEVPPGQVQIYGFGDRPPPSILAIVEREVGAPGPGVQLYDLNDDSSAVSLEPGGLGAVLAVETVDDAERLNRGPLQPAARDVLQQGGILLLDGSGARAAVPLYDNTASGAARSTEPLDGLAVAFDRYWSSAHRALILVETARTLDLPIRPTEVVLTDLNTAQVQAASSAVIAAGYDPTYVQVFRPARGLSLTGPLVLGIVGLGLMFFLGITWNVRGQVEALRPLGGALVAVGMSPWWIRRVILRIVATPVVLGFVLATVVAVVTSAVVCRRLGWPLVVPWGPLSMIVLALAGAAAAAALVAMQSIAPAERRR